MGGNAVGPNIGAFKDLAKEGVCKVYNSFEDLSKYLVLENEEGEEQKAKFFQENSWKNFAHYVEESREGS